MKKNFCNKLITFIISYLLILNTPLTVFAEGNFGIKENHGTVTNSWEPEAKSDKHVIHIKDVHCNHIVQKNIARILESLIEKNDVELITMEGACDKIDTSLFSSFPNKRVREDVCDKYAERGLLSGAEYLSITKGNELSFYLTGIEDKDLYTKSLDAFRKTILSSNVATNQINKLSSILKKLKGGIYPPPLYDFDAQAKLFDAGDLLYTDWIRLLRNKTTELNISLSDCDNFEYAVKSIDKTFNTISVMQEKNLLLLSLKKQLPSEEFNKIIAYDRQYSLNHISFGSYLSVLHKYLEKTVYPNLNGLYQLHLIKKKIDHVSLLSEMETVKHRIVSALISQLSDKEKATACISMDKITKHLVLVSKLLRTQLTFREYSTYLKNTHLFPVIEIVKQIKNIASAYDIDVDEGLLNDNLFLFVNNTIGSAERFYKLANERSNVLVNNLVSKMNDSKQNTAVIVSGGFHTDSIEKNLCENNIAFTEITPKADVTKNNVYFSLMMNNMIAVNHLSVNQEYISFPVLFDVSLDNSPYFLQIKKEFAYSLLTHKDSSVQDYLERLDNTNAKKMFLKLVSLSGLDIQNLRQITIKQFVDTFSIEDVVASILTYTNDKIVTELKLIGIDNNSTDFEKSKDLFASYLLNLVRLAEQIIPEQEDSSKEHLLLKLSSIFYKTQETKFSVLHEISKVKFSSLLAEKIFNDVSEQLDINLPENFSEENIEIHLLPHTQPLNIMFEATVHTDIVSRKYLIKGVNNNDKNQIALDILQQLGRPVPTHYKSTVTFNGYTGFHVREIGSVRADDFNDVSQMKELAQSLGKTYAESILLGLPNNSLTNFSVLLDSGNTPIDTSIIDLDSSFGINLNPESFFESVYIDLFVQKRIDLSDKQNTRQIIIAFLHNFQQTLKEIHEYSKKTDTDLDDLYKNISFNKWLSNLKTSEYLDLLEDTMTTAILFFNNRLNINVTRNNVDQYENLSVAKNIHSLENKRLQEFVTEQNFKRFIPADIANNAKLYLNKSGTTFLKERISLGEYYLKTKDIVKKKKSLKLWIRFFASIILLRMSTTNGLSLANDRIGKAVAPMYKFNLSSPIKLPEGRELKTAYLQKRMKFTLSDAFNKLTDKNDLNAIKNLIDAYISNQEDMWSRGVFDSDIYFYKNYATDNIHSSDVRCIDFDRLSDSITIAILCLTVKDYRIAKLRPILKDRNVPSECIDYFFQEYNKRITIKNLLKRWRKKKPVQAKQIEIKSTPNKKIQKDIHIQFIKDFLREIGMFKNIYLMDRMIDCLEKEQTTQKIPTQRSANITYKHLTAKTVYNLALMKLSFKIAISRGKISSVGQVFTRTSNTFYNYMNATPTPEKKYNDSGTNLIDTGSVLIEQSL